MGALANSGFFVTNLSRGLHYISAGTNVNRAKAAIEASEYQMIMADDLDEAASTAVRIAETVNQVCVEAFDATLRVSPVQYLRR